MWVLKKKSLADVMEERIKTDPKLWAPFDAAVKYVRRGQHPSCMRTSMLLKN